MKKTLLFGAMFAVLGGIVALLVIALRRLDGFLHLVAQDEDNELDVKYEELNEHFFDAPRPQADS